MSSCQHAAQGVIHIAVAAGLQFGLLLTQSAHNPVFSSDQNKPANPFLPYNDQLWVAHLSSTHTLLLNKYNVVAHHLLVVTRSFESQLDSLQLADLEAVLLVLQVLPGGCCVRLGWLLRLVLDSCGATQGLSRDSAESWLACTAHEEHVLIGWTGPLILSCHAAEFGPAAHHACVRKSRAPQPLHILYHCHAPWHIPSPSPPACRLSTGTGHAELLTATHAQAMPSRGLAFFNCGPQSGASQPHKHIQIVPQPLGDDSSNPLPFGPVIRESLEASPAPPCTAVPLRQLPFTSFCARLPPR